MKKLKVLFIAILLGAGFVATAQDYQLTQFYAAPLYINPGFAGTAGHSRIAFNNRHQWVNLSHPLRYYGFSFDHNLEELNSGFGLYANYATAGTSGYSNTEIAAVYSYSINLSKRWRLVPGLTFGYGKRGIDYEKMVFGDQIGQSGNRATLEEIPSQNSRSYFDFSSGILLYNEKVWLGAAANHLNEPNISLTGETSRLSRKFGVHGGLKFSLQNNPFYNTGNGREHTITPAFQFRMQGNSRQLDIGTYWNYEPVIVGVWYRGIPGVSNRYHDAIAVLLGVQFDQFQVGYSYDITVSGLGAASSGGSHELSLVWEFGRDKLKGKKYPKRLPCPKF